MNNTMLLTSNDSTMKVSVNALAAVLVAMDETRRETIHDFNHFVDGRDLYKAVRAEEHKNLDYLADEIASIIGSLVSGNDDQEERVEEMTRKNIPNFDGMKMNEIRAWVKANGYKAKARKKDDLIARLVAEINGDVSTKEATTKTTTNDTTKTTKEEATTTNEVPNFQAMKMAEIRAWVKDNGYTSKARSKAELIEKLTKEISNKETRKAEDGKHVINNDHMKDNYKVVAAMSADNKAVPSLVDGESQVAEDNEGQDLDGMSIEELRLVCHCRKPYRNVATMYLANEDTLKRRILAA